MLMTSHWGAQMPEGLRGFQALFWIGPGLMRRVAGRRVPTLSGPERGLWDGGGAGDSVLSRGGRGSTLSGPLEDHTCGHQQSSMR